MFKNVHHPWLSAIVIIPVYTPVQLETANSWKKLRLSPPPRSRPGRVPNRVDACPVIKFPAFNLEPYSLKQVGPERNKGG